ncbi:MAG: DJ-1/PfpI family protein [Desulfosarcinaceae bacterium]|nr:DJ-1/PfpI family protein [Desulfosarcinaceae bacterium]
MLDIWYWMNGPVEERREGDIDTMTKRVLVPIADGTEEMEAVIIIDVLRRAGADVTVASVGKPQVTASRGVKLVADTTIEACRDSVFDLIVLPGGIPGAEHLRDSAVLVSMLKRQRSAKRWYGAICAAPAVVLAHHGLLEEGGATCHPSFAQLLPEASRIDQAVVKTGHCVTSQGPGTAMRFALELTALLFGRTAAQTVAAGMVVSSTDP